MSKLEHTKALINDPVYFLPSPPLAFLLGLWRRAELPSCWYGRGLEASRQGAWLREKLLGPQCRWGTTGGGSEGANRGCRQNTLGSQALEAIWSNPHIS